MPSITYQFEWGFATYDVDTEQDAINTIEEAGQYLSKTEVNDLEADMIMQGAEIVPTDGGIVINPTEDLTPTPPPVEIPEGQIAIGGNE